MTPGLLQGTPWVIYYFYNSIIVFLAKHVISATLVYLNGGLPPPRVVLVHNGITTHHGQLV